MTAKELEKVLDSIDLSSLSDKELEQLFKVVRKFYGQLKQIKNYLDYTEYKSSKKRRSFLSFFFRFNKDIYSSSY